MSLSGVTHRTVAGRALRAFLGTEAAGGVVLVLAAIAGLIWANSPWSGSYERVWHTELALQLGDAHLALDLRHWINDGLMALFFLVVGVEIKRELVEGDLGDRRTAALPVAAAIGGMVVPAALFLAIVGGGDASRGWGIPMATDIAFALGVMALVARRLPSSLRVFLLTLAIVDDIGAIVVIAVFYSDDLDPQWGLVAGLVALVVYGCRRAGIAYSPLFVGLGIAMWFTLHESGIHATLAGVAMGLLAPARPALERSIVTSRLDELVDVFSPEAARTTTRIARRSVSDMQWIEHVLHPWTSFVIVPLFALANAGVNLSDGGLEAVTSRVGLGVLVGLVIGKPVGIMLASLLASRAGLAVIPPDVGLRQLAGVSVLGGVGFTVSIFVTGLAYSSDALQSDAKVAILVASVVASTVGALILVLSRSPPSAVDADG